MKEPSAGWASSPHSVGGDVDIAAVGALVADPARCRILLALADGRALPANRLAAEAGISAATASSHLGKLTTAGLLLVEARGRYRFYRLAGPEVGTLIEALERFAPALPVRSLRQSHRAQTLREARMCYDHLAGRLGVNLMRVMIERGYLTGYDDAHDPTGAQRDQRAPDGAVADIDDYALTERGKSFLDAFGVQLPAHRQSVRYHMDSSEQRLHLSGTLGRGLLNRFIELEWIRRSDDSRAVLITQAGRQGLAESFEIHPDA
ncbi:metalloregulator ArsR/SmtB family transcription factor [Streptosporangium subroseum]|uniref:ArsR/SmtB family transcription factor n=1 Tax=Streptosporangium subroseum TaxID=106412 RepID=UPI003421B9E6